MENFIVNNIQEVVTFGCRLNIYESEIIKKNLVASGLENVIVFNTCTVTKEAEKSALQAIRKAKRNDPNVRIIVTGCGAQVNPTLFAKMIEVDKVIGNAEKLSPIHYQISDDKIAVNNIMSIKETANHLISSFDGKSRAFLQVQNGCNHRCTYCIIPFGRGRSRSVPIGVIVNQIKHLMELGYNEVVFTGVDVTSYGADLPGAPTFAQMIRRVLQLVPELSRLRLSSIDVAEIDDELFEMMAYSQKLMPHFHISLQSGDDTILGLMKRRHTRTDVIDFCNKLRNIRKDVSFGADIIAGFPLETDEMFENTKSLIVEADLQYLHVFPYSERHGTPAARMIQIEKQIRKARAEILRIEGQKQLQKFFKKNLYQTVKLLVEKNATAHTENFIPVKILGNANPSEIIMGQLIGFESNYMIAQV